MFWCVFDYLFVFGSSHSVGFGLPNWFSNNDSIITAWPFAENSSWRLKVICNRTDDICLLYWVLMPMGFFGRCDGVFNIKNVGWFSGMKVEWRHVWDLQWNSTIRFVGYSLWREWLEWSGLICVGRRAFSWFLSWLQIFCLVKWFFELNESCYLRYLKVVSVDTES